MSADTGLWSGGDPRVVTLRRERDDVAQRLEQLQAGVRKASIVLMNTDDECAGRAFNMLAEAQRKTGGEQPS